MSVKDFFEETNPDYKNKSFTKVIFSLSYFCQIVIQPFFTEKKRIRFDNKNIFF